MAVFEQEVAARQEKREQAAQQAAEVRASGRLSLQCYYSCSLHLLGVVPLLCPILQECNYHCGLHLFSAAPLLWPILSTCNYCYALHLFGVASMSCSSRPRLQLHAVVDGTPLLTLH